MNHFRKFDYSVIVLLGSFFKNIHKVSTRGQFLSRIHPTISLNSSKEKNLNKMKKNRSFMSGSLVKYKFTGAYFASWITIEPPPIALVGSTSSSAPSKLS